MNVKSILIFSCLYFILFIVAETAYHYFKIKAESTRKFVHLITGLIALFFPIYLKNPLDLIFICAGFMAILLLSIQFKFLQSVNDIERPSRGSILFPIIVIICYFFQYYRGNYIYYFIPILILAVADPLAAYIGQKFQYKKFSILNNSKTLSGSFSFFIAALLISLIGLIISKESHSISLYFCAISIAVVTTIGEAISIKGYDNLIVPLFTIAVLLIFGI